MTTDPTPLTKRLIDAAWEAGKTEFWSAELPDDQAVMWHCIGEAAVVAVLRELADEYTDEDGSWYVINPPRLRALADSIEKGRDR